MSTIDEIIRSYRASTAREFGCIQEYQLPETEDVVRHNVEVDRGAITPDLLNVSTMIYIFSPWTRSAQCHDQAIKWAKAKVHVYSDSVLCLGKMHSHSEANEKWKSQIKEFQESNEYAELSGIDGEPIEFEWNVFPGFAKIEILGETVKDLNARQMNPEQFEGLILLMSMFNDIDWTQKGKFITLLL